MSIQSRVPAAEYRLIEALNISALKEMTRSPRHFQHAISHPKATKPLSLGSAAHCATLEPKRFLDEFAAWTRRSEKTGNLCPRNGQHWDAFADANADKTIITADEYVLATNIAVAVRGDPVASTYLLNGEPEVVLLWDHDRPCKGRIDWLTVGDETAIVGLKTARDVRPFWFGSQAARLGYHLQWAWYCDGFEAIRKVRPRMVEIVVESAPPHAVVVYEIPDDVLLQGREDYEKLLAQLVECETADHWPGPFTEVQALTLPTWAYAQGEDLSDLELQ